MKINFTIWLLTTDLFIKKIMFSFVEYLKECSERDLNFPFKSVRYL